MSLVSFLSMYKASNRPYGFAHLLRIVAADEPVWSTFSGEGNGRKLRPFCSPARYPYFFSSASPSSSSTSPTPSSPRLSSTPSLVTLFLPPHQAAAPAAQYHQGDSYGMPPIVVLATNCQSSKFPTVCCDSKPDAYCAFCAWSPRRGTGKLSQV